MRVGGVLIALFFGPGAAQAYHGRFWRGVRWGALFLVAAAASVLSPYAYLAAAAVYVANVIDGIWLSLSQPIGPRRWDLAVSFIGTYVALGFVLNAWVLGLYRIPSTSMAPTLPIGSHVMIEKVSYNWKAPAPGDVVVFEQPCQHRDFVSRVVATAGQTVEVRCGVVYVDGTAQAQDGRRPAKIHDEYDGQARDFDVIVKTEHLGGGTHEIAQFPDRPTDRDFPPLDGTAQPPSCASQEAGGTADAQTLGVLSPTTTDGPECAPHRHYTVPAGHVFVMGDDRDNSNDSRVWGAAPIASVRGRMMWHFHW